MNSLEIKGSFGFRSSSFFFKDIQFAINKPGLYAIVGKHGIGKSTFFRLLQGTIQEPEHLAGTIVLNNKNYNIAHELDRQALCKQIISIEQNYDHLMVPGFTGYEHLTFKNISQYPHFKRLASAEYAYLAQEFGIPLDQPVEKLFGIQRQMLALLLSINDHMKVLLLDEPIIPFDPDHASQLIVFLNFLIKRLHSIVLCIMHEELMVNHYVDGIYKMHSLPDATRTIEALPNVEKLKAEYQEIMIKNKEDKNYEIF